MSYSLDFTGELTRSIEQQRALAEYQQHQVEAAQLTVTGNAVNQALEVASLRAQIATVEALLDRDRENLKLVQLAFDAGSVSRLDVVSAQSQLASDTTLLPPLRQQLAEARHALALTLGAAPADPSLPELDLAQLTLPAQLPVSLPSELARRRPDILAAEAQLHAATAAVGVATSNLYPQHQSHRLDRSAIDHDRRALRQGEQRLEHRERPRRADLRWRHAARREARGSRRDALERARTTSKPC